MRQPGLTVLLALVIAGVIPVLAWGYWSGASGAGSQGAADAASVNQGAAPLAARSGADVVVSWGVSTLSSGQPVAGYIVQRYAAGSGVVQTILAGCAGTVATNSCTEAAVAVGQWQYTVTPVIGANWRGLESVKSGVVTVGSSFLTLSKSSLGSPLPRVITGSLSGFAPNEGVTYRLDAGTTLVGSPSSVNLAGTATITSLTIPNVADGPHTVYAIGGVASVASAGILIDTAPPTATTQLSPAPNAAGWSTGAVEVAISANDGNGSGVASITYTTDGSNPATSGTATVYSGPLSIPTTTLITYIATDNAGNNSAPQTQTVLIDPTPPSNALTLTPLSGNALMSANTVYYRGSGSGSFAVVNALSDTGGSGAASSATSALAGTSTGWTHTPSLVTTPSGGPYLSAPFSWTAGATSAPTETITGNDVAGNAAASTLTFVNDSAGPTGGSVDATGLLGTGGRYSRSLALSLSFTKGTDAAAGLASTGAQLVRASASLTSSNGIVDGTCGTYGAATPVGGADPTSPFADTVPTDDRCYRYGYQVPDGLGNLTTYNSPDIKVHTTAPGSLAPIAATITPLSGTAAQSASGPTVYYNPALSGSFAVDSTASDAVSGISALTFPALGGFAGGGGATSPFSGVTFRSIYSWSNNAASASPGLQPLTGTSGAGSTATNAGAFSVVADSTGPSGGTVDATGLVGTGARYSTSTTLSVALTKGSDAGSGLAATGAQLLRASASLSSPGTTDGTCGVYGTYVVIGAVDPSSPKSDVVPDHVCYRYHYVVSDKVGNATTYTSPDIKVDTTAPAAPTLAFSALTNAFASGTIVYYRPSTPGAFTVTGTGTDLYSGISSYAYPAFPAGWSSAAGAFGVNTYSWSANPTAPGSQNVISTNNAGVASLPRAMTLTPDTTAPATGTVSVTGGYYKTASVSVTFTKGTDLGSGLLTTSGLLQRASATLSAGSCGAFGAFATISTNPATSPVTDAGVLTGNCYQYQYLISDNVGNQATYTSATIAKVDTTLPVHVLSLVNAVGVVKVGTALYYKGNAAGSFQLLDTVTDAGSGPAFATFPVISTVGWTHAVETVSTPAGGPFTSSAISWTANPTNPGTYTVTGQDLATNTGTSALSWASDISAPSGGSVTYTNLVINSLSVPVTTATGTDTKAGVNLSSGILQRDQASLNTTTEVCGTFPGTFATTVTLLGGADTTVATGNCYKYRYLISDNLGNQAIYTSTNTAKVDTGGPRVTAIVSKQSGGVTAGNGQLELSDRLILTFNQSLATASVPATVTGATESRTTGTVQLTIPGITSGALNTGNAAYLASTGTKTATFNGTVALVNNGTTTTVTITVTTLTGDPTALSSGTLTFQPAATITDGGGDPAIGPFTTATTFKLF